MKIKIGSATYYGQKILDRYPKLSEINTQAITKGRKAGYCCTEHFATLGEATDWMLKNIYSSIIVYKNHPEIIIHEVI